MTAIRHRLRWLGPFLLLVCLLGCKQASREALPEGKVKALPIGTAECGVCGMVVREQPAPRGQMRHRDGKQVWFCSVGDMAQYLRAPSAHGKASHVWVEALPADADPRRPDVAPRPWYPAAELHHVLGIARPGIMGAPVMSYAAAAEARAVVARSGGEVLPWTELQARLVASAERPGGPTPTPIQQE